MRPIPPLRLLFTALLLAVAAPGAARAQSAPSADTTAPASAPAALPQGAIDSALPADREPAPPRTLRAYWHVWIAFSVAWLLLFGYVLSLGRRFGRLEDEVRRLG